MIKRCVDIVVSLVGLLIFLPFGLVIVLVLKLTGEGQVFFRQPRMGKGGRTFGLLKFVTMMKDSQNMGTGLLTVQDDPRVLPFGRFLRRTKLNEVPQLLNIVAGDMSIIGPRPQAVSHFMLFPEHARTEITKVRPGLSGIGSIVFRDEESLLNAKGGSVTQTYASEISRYKGELEVWYIKNQTLWVDFLLFVLTAWVILFPGSGIVDRVFKDLPSSDLFQRKT
jgi:lipopolysaccharide/colanic/teichoic acid biosynthesis glycosyltransferase